MKTVCIFAASSSKIENVYREAASKLGVLLAANRKHVIYGGGGIGLMGALADSFMASGGSITGVIPEFMVKEGWGHKDVADMIVTADMSERKKLILNRSDAVVALPGGIGTVEELTEAITLKQLGIFRGPVIVLNTNGYWDHFMVFMRHMIETNFMRLEHEGIWSVVESPEDVISELNNYKGWLDDPRSIARID
jgi:uncharacterized protein (TIGR00730 family)